MPMMNEHYLETMKVIDGIDMGSKGVKRKCALFVMVQNENVFLPIWLKYYTKFFHADDLFVLDHRSEDGSVDRCAAKYSFRRIRLEYPFSFDHLWFRFVANAMQEKLLKYYEYVIFTDVDEIIIPDPDYYSGLDEYIMKLKKKYVRCTGYELINMKEKEKPYESEKSVLSQRDYWYRTPFYDKTLISSQMLNWTIGFHRVKQIIKNHDKKLLLVHLHKLDYDLCWNKSLERSKLEWSQEELNANRGWQNRITDPEKFNEYFYHWPKYVSLLRKIKIVKIPEKIKKTDIF